MLTPGQETTETRATLPLLYFTHARAQKVPVMTMTDPLLDYAVTDLTCSHSSGQGQAAYMPSGAC
jgi:hypothetical protein